MSDSLPDRLLLFDGHCNLCNGVVQFVIKRDPKGLIKFATLQGEIGNQFAIGDVDSVVYVRNGKPLIKSDAVLMLAKDLGGLWSLFYAFIAVPRFIRNWCYDVVAKSRYSLFGKRSECMVPTPELQSRFLD